MKPALGTCDKDAKLHEQKPECINFVPKTPWWKQALASLGNAIGESLFGGNR